MTELDQLKADLATIQKAAEIAKKLGWHERTGNYNQVEGKLKQRIADLEAKQAPEDEWWAVKGMIGKFSDDYDLKKYVRHLEAKVAELENKLRCERIDGGKVRDDLKARIAEMEQHGRRVDQANHEHYGRLQDQIAIRDLKIEKLERQAPAERNREKLAELVTIQNAIPAACGLARELVERRIEQVKKEMQGNG